MSMNNLLIEAQNQVTALTAERDKLAAQVNTLRTAALNAICVMSGGNEKADLRDAYDATPEQCLADIRSKTLEDAVYLYTHKWTKEFEDVHISLISKGAGFIHPEALLQYALDIRQSTEDGA